MYLLNLNGWRPISNPLHKSPFLSTVPFIPRLVEIVLVFNSFLNEISNISPNTNVENSSYVKAGLSHI